ncbi:MAG TPA: uracil-DNA glycosylase [Candidatus Nanopelagicaceae bacterium]|nr:uracil-DNA glycosylase [Candidatus Nanopelagicaceae bacterium]
MDDPLAGMHPSWRPQLREVAGTISDIGEFLRQEISQGRSYLPEGRNILRAFQSEFESVRVLIVGQDPYPTPGHAVGLSFSVSPETWPLPRSLQNIFRELQSDLDIPVPTHGDLISWASQGVLLLNRVLTVMPGSPASHRGRGWETVTETAIRALTARSTPLVAILWGRDAQATAPFLGDTPLIMSPHPSPMSADRGFFGSKPFSRANAFLKLRGAEPIDWGRITAP